MEGDIDDDETTNMRMRHRLLSSLYVNQDGHLSHNRKLHEVQKTDTCAVLYFFRPVKTENDLGIATIIEPLHLYHRQGNTYKGWHRTVLSELDHYPDFIRRCFYGWITLRLRVTPIRTGDLLIKITKEEWSYACFSFDRNQPTKVIKNAKI